MLERIECSGFKSLNDFSLDFVPGLNVLVGPNGSGKTNIILLLEFLSRLRQNTIIDAVSKVGGAGKIFRRRSEGLLLSEISFSIKGRGYAIYPRPHQRREGSYIYEATISLSAEKNSIAFSRQRLSIEIENPKQEMDQLIEGAQSGSKFDVNVIIDKEGKVKAFFKSLDVGASRYPRPMKRPELQEVVEDLASLSGSNTLFDLFDRYIAGCDMVSRDVGSAKSFNIDPSKVRETEDIATPPYIQFDGEGFAATLNALQPSPANPVRLGPMPYFNRKREFEDADELLKQIVSYSTLVNNNIVDLSVNSDPIESRLSVFVHFKYENGFLKLPISLVSDGTAKWLALATAVLTRQNIFAIEEPENFLHPTMQSEIINLVRQHFETSNDRYRDRFAIITTHSETIINACRPNELIIIDIEQGATKASRVANISDVVQELENTGFGLGYYYLAGALSE